jgi:O-antigen/teichoic acid export membrane protein
VLVLAIVAAPALEILGGAQYRDAAPVLRIQALALIPVFVGQICQLGLLSIRRQRDLAIANTLALVFVVILGLILIPLDGAIGAAIAAVVAELSLALMLWWFLHRERGELAPNFNVLPRLALAAAVAGAVAFIPGIPELLAGAIAGVLYLAFAFVLHAVPPELLHAVRQRGARA